MIVDLSSWSLYFISCRISIVGKSSHHKSQIFYCMIHTFDSSLFNSISILRNFNGTLIMFVYASLLIIIRVFLSTFSVNRLSNALFQYFFQFYCKNTLLVGVSNESFFLPSPFVRLIRIIVDPQGSLVMVDASRNSLRSNLLSPAPIC